MKCYFCKGDFEKEKLIPIYVMSEEEYKQGKKHHRKYTCYDCGSGIIMVKDKSLFIKKRVKADVQTIRSDDGGVLARVIKGCET